MCRLVQGLVEDIQQAGGIITVQDLQDAQPTVKAAITSQVWGLDVITVPPPSSGAVLVAALHILQGAGPVQALSSGSLEDASAMPSTQMYCCRKMPPLLPQFLQTSRLAFRTVGHS